MEIFPTIELMGGRCVSLQRGRIEEPVIWHVDPVARARGFAEAGAAWLHVTDFDAVMRAETDNAELVREIIRAARIPVQVGGGMGTMERIESWLDHGAGRVVIGTTAVASPDFVKRAAKRWPDQIVLAVDVWQGTVTTSGWRTQTAFDPVDFIGHFETDPLAAIIVTDIDADIGDADASLALVTRCADAARVPVLARGTVRGLDDISRLKYVPHVAGTLVGRALFDRSVELEDALAVARGAPEPVAPFV